MKKVLSKLNKFFTTYEKIWLLSVIALSVGFAILFPEEDKWFLQMIAITSVISSVVCELLIAKQSRWNFIVSLLFVETTTIALYLFYGYYTGALTTLLFWIPIDTISFFNWNKHKDDKDKDLTKVRLLNVKMEIVVGISVAAFCVLFGYLSSLIGGEATYIDSLCSAVGIVNGLFILLRYTEQWVAWMIYVILDAILWILSGQFIMLILTAGYVTNTIYGFVKWLKYSKNHLPKVQVTEIQQKPDMPITTNTNEVEQ